MAKEASTLAGPATVTGHTARKGSDKDVSFEVADQKLTLRVGSEVVVFGRDELHRLEKLVRRAKGAV